MPCGPSEGFTSAPASREELLCTWRGRRERAIDSLFSGPGPPGFGARFHSLLAGWPSLSSFPFPISSFSRLLRRMAVSPWRCLEWCLAQSVSYDRSKTLAFPCLYADAIVRGQGAPLEERIRPFPKEDIQGANRYMTRFSTSLIIREIHIKTPRRYHLAPVRMVLKKLRENSVGEAMEKKCWCILGGKANWCSHCGK